MADTDSSGLTATIDDTGIAAPSYDEVLSGLKSQYAAIYGDDVYLEADSQDGQFLAILALAIADANAMAVAVYNAYSPATAAGEGLSRNVKINGLTRVTATTGTVDLLLTGQSGTVISDGAAQDEADNYWDLPASVTIDATGQVTVTATAREAGAVTAAAGTVTTIATPTLGWQSVTNPAAASAGRAAETDAELRVRQAASTALPSLSVLEGLYGAVAAVEGVTLVRAYENDTDAADDNGQPAHSVALVVQGGEAAAIAAVIAAKKTPGTYTHGSTAVALTDDVGIPATIRFFRPTEVPITVTITIAALAGYVATTLDTIAATVAAQIAALGIGQNVVLSKLYAPANLTGDSLTDTFDVTALAIARDGAAPTSANVAIAFTELATCAAESVTVTVE